MENQNLIDILGNLSISSYVIIRSKYKQRIIYEGLLKNINEYGYKRIELYQHCRFWSKEEDGVFVIQEV